MGMLEKALEGGKFGVTVEMEMCIRDRSLYD